MLSPTWSVARKRKRSFVKREIKLHIKSVFFYILRVGSAYLAVVACLNLWNPGASLALSEARWRKLVKIYIGWRKVRFVDTSWLPGWRRAAVLALTPKLLYFLLTWSHWRKRDGVSVSVSIYPTNMYLQS